MFCMIQELEMKLAAFQEQATTAENVSETFEEKVQAYEQKMKVRFANTDFYLHVLCKQTFDDDVATQELCEVCDWLSLARECKTE